MKEVILEKIGFADAARLQKLAIQTFTETFAAVNTAENMQAYISTQLSLEKLQGELSNPGSSFYLALVCGNPAGYLKLNTGNAQTDLCDPKAMEIERIYVQQDYHGKKLGQLLFDKALEVAGNAGVDYIWLGVWENNEKAIRFYEKNGFTRSGTHVFRLGEDEQTDWIMKRRMK